METSFRPFDPWNSTTPWRRANSVSSPPFPTPSPGWMRVPRWRTMIEPAGTAWPANTLTPSRLDLESRPFLVEPPPFLCAMAVTQGSRRPVSGLVPRGLFGLGLFGLGLFGLGLFGLGLFDLGLFGLLRR